MITVSWETVLIVSYDSIIVQYFLSAVMFYLWFRVVCIYNRFLCLADPNVRADVQVSVQVGSAPPFITAKAPSPNPKWEENVML